MQNFSLSVEKCFTREHTKRVKSFSTGAEKAISKSNHTLFCLFYRPTNNIVFMIF